MAIALTVPTEVEVGAPVTVTATGLTHGGNVTLEVYTDEGFGGIAATVHGAADGSGNFTTVGLLDFSANVDGHLNYKLTDVTAVAAVTGKTKVTVVN